MYRLSTTIAALALLAGGTTAVTAAPVTQANGYNPDLTMSAAECIIPGDNARLRKDNTSLAKELHSEGIRFDWMARDGNCIDVAVVSPTGTISRELFDPNTLQRVRRSGSGAERIEDAIGAVS
jgi:hypothetical protein